MFLKFKATSSELNAALLVLINASKDVLVDNMKKAMLYGYIYDFLLYYDNDDIENILGIHQYFSR